MDKLLKKKTLISVLAIILFIVLLLSAIIGCTNDVTLAASAEEDVIYYGDDTTYGEAVESSTSDYEEFTYTTKNESYYLINPSFPTFYNINQNLKNGCANVAGANIIGFYDRFYDDFIPNSTAGVLRNNIYTYYPMPVAGDQKQAVIDALYVDMKTNNPNAGTSQANYKTGLTAFINRKGKNVSFTSVMTNGKFDLNKAIAQFQQGNPITLYMQGYNVTTLSDVGSQVRLTKIIYNTNHIMIAYGYEKVEYYNNGVLIKTKTYLYVSCGLQGITGGIYIIDNNGILNDAESVKID